MVCDLGGVSGVRVVFEPGGVDLRAVLEDRGTRIPGALYGWAPAGGFRVARGLGRHRHRSNRTAGSAQACELQAAEKFYLVAGSGGILSRDGSYSGDDGSVD